ncbi:MAG TPA: 3-deoxy-7-phosphoheptulonate synthase [Coxiellaceae bacterium]|nr:3-deoxy-7-phosphoheptulonate synthase [Coxiellaceae bacterium]
MSALITPEALQTALSITQKSATTVASVREQVMRVLDGKDNRLVVIVGPCSIHHPESALRYAKKLKTQIDKHKKTLCIIMRAYIEKARTSIGWKGFINDPDLNNTFNIEKGLNHARKLLIAINELGVPTGIEILNPFTAAYFADLASWSVVGARTTESQMHREFVSGLPMPVGFKNNTNGDVQVAIDAAQTARQSHHYLGLDLSGKIAILQSHGNPYAHIVLRGSQTESNYDTNTIQRTVSSLTQLNLINRVLIDCSHGNSRKNYAEQMNVIHELSARIKNGDKNIFGVMIESHLTAGKQAWTPNQVMRGDQSVTDGCIGWDQTEMALDQLSCAMLE